MKKLILIIAFGITLLFSTILPTFAIENIDINNLDAGQIKEGDSTRNETLKSFGDDDFYDVGTTGEKGIMQVLVRIAKDLKNAFFIFATIFYIIIVLKLLTSDKSDEALEGFKKGIIWITIGLIVMQIAYAYTRILFNNDFDQSLGASLLNNLINPLIRTIEMLVSLVFISIAIYSFYRLVTANGDDEKAKSAKTTIVQAIIGFIIIKFAKSIVEAVYGKIYCNTTAGGLLRLGSECLDKANLTGVSDIVVTIIEWLNSFVGLAMILMIIYAGFLVLTSGGEEEKLKGAKSSLLYIAIGGFILVANYLILTFFIIPEQAI